MLTMLRRKEQTICSSPALMFVWLVASTSLSVNALWGTNVVTHKCSLNHPGVPAKPIRHVRTSAKPLISRYVTNSHHGQNMVDPSMTHIPSDLAVRLDRPVLTPSYGSGASARNSAWKSLLPLLVSDVFKTAAVAFMLAFFLSLLARSSVAFSPSQAFSGVENIFKLARGKVIRIWDSIKARVTGRTPGVPMDFDGDDGWGKCTLQSKRSIGKSPFVEYNFELPHKDNTLPLHLGQKLTLCCLDEDDNIAQGDFFLYSPRSTKGYFSIVAPYGTSDEVEYALGSDNANFARVMDDELKVGDEVAIKPGNSTLDYRGQYFPVTDMVYLASGSGIVPIIDQVQSVLPSRSSSSVKSVSVVWVNEDAKGFDLAFAQLEGEFYKYNTKLEVSCCVEDTRNGSLEDYEDIEQSVPDFTPGTMAVVSGPSNFAEKASWYLRSRGYPSDCICTLPP